MEVFGWRCLARQSSLGLALGKRIYLHVLTPASRRARRRWGGAASQSFEQLNPRAVAVVVDPIQSVKGKVVIDCFRLINPQSIMLGQEPRQTTSNVGHLNKPTIQVPRARSVY